MIEHCNQSKITSQLPKTGTSEVNYSSHKYVTILGNNNQSIITLFCLICFRHQARQDHLMRAHFFSKVEAAFPDMKTRNCPFPDCNFIGKDKQVRFNYSSNSLHLEESNVIVYLSALFYYFGICKVSLLCFDTP